MRCARPILGYRSYKFSTQKIMSELGWLTAYQIIMKESILFVHKTIYNNHPKAIFDLFTFSFSNSNNIRTIRKPMRDVYYRSKKAQKLMLFMGLYLYNKLSNDDKTMNPKRLSKYLNNNVQFYFPFDRIIKLDHG